MLQEVTSLCEEFPHRFHVLGANWLRAACQLKDLISSLDSAEWLVGGRYGFVVFLNTRSRQLQRAPARVLGLAHLTRAERNIECAKAINDFFNRSPAAPLAAESAQRKAA